MILVASPLFPTWYGPETCVLHPLRKVGHQNRAICTCSVIDMTYNCKCIYIYINVHVWIIINININININTNIKWYIFLKNKQDITSTTLGKTLAGGTFNPPSHNGSAWYTHSLKWAAWFFFQWNQQIFAAFKQDIIKLIARCSELNQGHFPWEVLSCFCF